MDLILGIIVGLVVLTILVGLHEFGHAYMAKRNGVKLKEFAIGFPPRAWSFKKKTDFLLPKGTVVSINYLPLGGFVRLQGEHDSDNKEGDYGAASFWDKTQILFAGVVMNWIIAIVIFTGLAFFGLPKLIPNQFAPAGIAKTTGGELVVEKVEEGSEAEKILKPKDILMSFNGQNITSPEVFHNLVESNAGHRAQLEILRDNKKETVDTYIPSESTPEKGRLGVTSAQTSEKIYATWGAPIVGVGTTAQLTIETFKGIGGAIGDLFVGLFNKFNPTADKTTHETGDSQLSKAGNSVAGPIAILGVIFPSAAKSGIVSILVIMAIISLSLACMNFLPIPALDGGRWFLTFVFRKILKKPLTAETETKINTYGVLFILALSVVIIAVDIFKIL